MRFLGHVLAAAWIGAASLQRTGAFRSVEVLTAPLLGGYALVSPRVPVVALAPTGPLLVTWCALIGPARRRIARCHPTRPAPAGSPRRASAH